MKITLALCFLVVVLTVCEQLNESYPMEIPHEEAVAEPEVPYSRSNPIQVMRSRFDLARLPDGLH